ncbi:MAG: LysM peptidoglycan-binding domain-containing protein [Planctomycetota bacterium]|nr:MAG: LysM peptidoglycan-binding domain-containing protein [Planctomycetota bacterium]
MRKVFFSLVLVLMGAGAVYLVSNFKFDGSFSLVTKKAPKVAKAGKADVKKPVKAASKDALPATRAKLTAVLEKIQAGKSTDLPADYFSVVRLAREVGDDQTYVSAMRHLVEAFSKSGQALKVAPELAGVYAAKNDFETARRIYSFAYKRAADYRERRALAAKLDPICERLIFSRKKFSECVFYRVQQGDKLIRLAAKYNCPYRFIQRINKKRDDRLRIGERLKIICGPDDSKMNVKVVVCKSEFTLTVYLNGVYMRSYPVAIGRDDATPTATFKIVDRLKHPAWHAPDGNVYPYGSKKNILGEYWLKFNDDEYSGFGIHGTGDSTVDPKKPETIQRAISAGCIRMFNRDVTDLSMLVPRGTVVEIRE